MDSRVSFIELGDVDGPREAGESDDTRELPAGDAVTLDPCRAASFFFIFITDIERLISFSL